MTAQDLWEKLLAPPLNAKLSVKDGTLWVSAKLGVITADLAELIKSRKVELVRLLTSYPCAGCGENYRFREPGLFCFTCRPKGGVGTPEAPAKDPNRFARPWQHRAQRARKESQTSAEKNQEDLL